MTGAHDACAALACIMRVEVQNACTCLNLTPRPPIAHLPETHPLWECVRTFRARLHCRHGQGGLHHWPTRGGAWRSEQLVQPGQARGELSIPEDGAA